MTPQATKGRLRRLTKIVVREWREIGGLGRLATVGILASAALAIGLGFSITADARGHLLDARADILEGITADLSATYGFPVDPSAQQEFDSQVRELLVGGETVRVKIWTRDGLVAYSDDTDLIGQRFELSSAARRAFTGLRTSQVSDLTEPAHAAHRALGSLIEFYLPYTSDGDRVTAVFEIEQRTDLLEEALGRIERNVWLSIGGGLTALGLFLGVLAMARARDLNRRRRQAEEILGDSLRGQEQERKRIIGSLHDDVGQPLYRLLYGLEGTMARMPPEDPLRSELASLARLVHQVDGTLRAELQMLHRGLIADLGLETALNDLVATVGSESDLEVTLTTRIEAEPSEVPRRAIFRAAAEALTNARKHSQAHAVSVDVVADAGEVTLTVRDDGSGRVAVPGLGLTTMRERLESLGGSLVVRGKPGRGTVLIASVPASIGHEA